MSRRRRGAATLAGLVVAATLATACSSGSAPDAAGAGVPTSATVADALPAGGFAALNPGVGYGLLRVMTLDERPDPLDVVIYQALPNELPRVAGVITTVAQTPLSHVNLRAVQDGVPNAYVAGVLDDPTIAALVGRYVRYSASAEGLSVTAATQAEVAAHHAASRPAEAQTPERDLTVRTIRPLSRIGFADWKAFGVKAANLATLRTFDLPDTDVPDGFAVPFSFYEEFMRVNGFTDRVRELLADQVFRSDPDVQATQLEQLRKDIKDAPMPAWMTAALDEMMRSFPAGTSLRCRSSTNNEDLPGFNGAGLYDSKTQRPDEGHVSKCIKQVYASVWNLRAFLERDFYRIDHLATAMGVLIHPNFTDEQANGVAVSTDPLYRTPGASYVNAQVGENLVTNPGPSAVPEGLLVDADGTVTVLTRSNLAEPGERVLSDAVVARLRTDLTIVRDRFKALYGVGSEPFAMEVEFKITAAGRLTIKQARAWVFNEG